MNQDSTKPKSTTKGTSKPPRKAKGQHAIRGGTPPANRQAVAILEVLAGERSPTEAATCLEISLVRYFQLETRALEGLVAALEPRPRGKQRSPDGQLKQLQKQLQQARAECTRQQALVRITQRTLGFPGRAPTNSKASPPRDRTGRKKRRPMVRALKAARTLQTRSQQAEASVMGSVDAAVPPIAAEKHRPDSASGVQLDALPAGTQEGRPQEIESVTY